MESEEYVRIKTMDILNTRFSRSTLTALIAFQAVVSFFSLLLPLSYKLSLTDITSRLGQLTQGHDYRRFIPLVEAMPAGLMGLSAISGILYLMAAWLLLRQRVTSFLAFAAALAISLVHWSIITRIPAYHQVLSLPASSWQFDYPIPAPQLVLPLLMMVVLWQMLRQSTVTASVASGLDERERRAVKMKPTANNREIA
jgi:hypothetical protein